MNIFSREVNNSFKKCYFLKSQVGHATQIFNHHFFGQLSFTG